MFIWVIKMLQGKESLDDKKQIAWWERSVSGFNDFILFHLSLNIFYFTAIIN